MNSTKPIRIFLAKLREQHKGCIPITAPASNMIVILLTLEKDNTPDQRCNNKRNLAYQLGRLEAGWRDHQLCHVTAGD